MTKILEIFLHPVARLSYAALFIMTFIIGFNLSFVLILLTLFFSGILSYIFFKT